MIRNLATALVAMALLVLLGEAVMRTIIPAPLPWLDPQTLYQPDPALHYRMRPNQATFTADKPCRTNGLGLRGGEIEIPKPAGVYRIMLLGDSIAFGFGVAEDDTFARLLERRLNDGAHAMTRYQVVNAAQPAFNTRQEVTYFAREGLQLDPDAVILALYWNDIHSEMLQHADALGRLVEGPPEANVGAFGEFLMAAPIRRLRNFVKRSRLLYFITYRARTIETRFSADNLSSTFMSVLLGRDDPRVEAGWRMVEAELQRLQAICRERSLPLLVAVMPMEEVLPDRFPRAEYPARVLELCRRNDLRCVDLHPPFREIAARGTSGFIDYDDAHPNEEGHRIIARELSAVLEDTGVQTAVRTR